jgi:hypothetical protein
MMTPGQHKLDVLIRSADAGALRSRSPDAASGTGCDASRTMDL